MSSSARTPGRLVESALRGLQRFAQRHLPHGRTLPEAEWQRRHRGILALLWVLAATLPLYGILQGHALSHDLTSGLGLLAVAALASRISSRHAASSAIASYGLCMGSAIAVHLANGAIEAHFMFFVVIIVISLYEDWRPFLIAFGFVVAHHGLMGAIAHDSVYSHAGNPWVLALIHGGFVAAAGIASLVSWRLNESLREESRRASDRAQESDARFRSAFEDGPLGMALVEMSNTEIGTLRQVNRTLCKQFGHCESELRGSSLQPLLEPASITQMLALIASLRAGGVTVAHDELALRHHDGHLFEGAISMSLVAGTSDDGAPCPAGDLIVQIEDVTERNRLKRELQDLADHDPLTGLVNRRRFSAEIARRLDKSAGHCAGGAVILIDLDGFKEINDTLGHESGDELLIAVSAALRDTCRADDVIARLGGDEFALLIGNATASAARSVAERIVKALHERAVIGYGATERRASASVGVVVYSRDTEMTGDQLLNDADLAMYEAKDDGGNRCAVHAADPGGSDHAPSWPERIRRALDDEHMTLYAQPILDLHSDAITNFELLLRMIGPDGEIIAPGAFLPVAERRGMIRSIDRWLIGQAVKLLHDLDPEHEDRVAHARNGIRLHVNLSGRSLSDVDFMDFIRAEIAGAGVDPSQLVFEITETAAIANVDDACRFLTDLSELGCGIALDDFGAGFGSLHYLKNLPVDLLKIDGQFISNLTTNPDDLVVVESLVRMAGGLRMRTAAEYVEDAATLQLIGDLGVDFAQGYHVGRPGPARQVINAARSARTHER